MPKTRAKSARERVEIMAQHYGGAPARYNDVTSSDDEESMSFSTVRSLVPTRASSSSLGGGGGGGGGGSSGGRGISGGNGATNGNTTDYEDDDDRSYIPLHLDSTKVAVQPQRQQRIRPMMPPPSTVVTQAIDGEKGNGDREESAAPSSPSMRIDSREDVVRRQERRLDGGGPRRRDEEQQRRPMRDRVDLHPQARRNLMNNPRMRDQQPAQPQQQQQQQRQQAFQQQQQPFSGGKRVRTPTSSIPVRNGEYVVFVRRQIKYGRPISEQPWYQMAMAVSGASGTDVTELIGVPDVRRRPATASVPISVPMPYVNDVTLGYMNVVPQQVVVPQPQQQQRQQPAAQPQSEQDIDDLFSQEDYEAVRVVDGSSLETSSDKQNEETEDEDEQNEETEEEEDEQMQRDAPQVDEGVQQLRDIERRRKQKQQTIEFIGSARRGRIPVGQGNGGSPSGPSTPGGGRGGGVSSSRSKKTGASEKVEAGYVRLKTDIETLVDEPGLINPVSLRRVRDLNTTLQMAEQLERRRRVAEADEDPLAWLAQPWTSRDVPLKPRYAMALDAARDMVRQRFPRTLNQATVEQFENSQTTRTAFAFIAAALINRAFFVRGRSPLRASDYPRYEEGVSYGMQSMRFARIVGGGRAVEIDQGAQRSFSEQRAARSPWCQASSQYGSSSAIGGGALSVGGGWGGGGGGGGEYFGAALKRGLLQTPGFTALQGQAAQSSPYGGRGVFL